MFTYSLAQSETLAQLYESVGEMSNATADMAAGGVSPAQVLESTADLTKTLLPPVDAAITTLGELDVTRQHFASEIAALRSDLAEYSAIVDRIIDDVPAAGASSSTVELVVQAQAVLQRMSGSAVGMRTRGNQDAAQTAVELEEDSRGNALLLIAGGAISLVILLVVVLAVIRNLVPRIRNYSHFATEIAAGRSPGKLTPRGEDELAELGVALNDMVESNALRIRDEQMQSEFVDTLQVSATEDEAQDLVKRHIERFVTSGVATVLKRNNSANRLQPATALAADSEMSARLLGAEPRSCMSVRFGRTHQEGTARAPLMSCTICSHQPPVSRYWWAARSSVRWW